MGEADVISLLDPLVGKWVLHKTTDTVGRVKTVFRPNEYISRINARPVAAIVVEMEEGDSFVVLGEQHVSNFVVLDERHGAVYHSVQTALAAVLRESIPLFRAVSIDPSLCVVLLVSILKRQLAALQVARCKSVDESGVQGFNGESIG